MARVYVAGNAHKIAAGLLANSSVLDVEAEKVKAKAAANVHNRSGDYARSLRVRKELAPGASTVHDRIVEATDRAALAIEFGHTAKDGAFVPGQYPLTRAAR